MQFSTIAKTCVAACLSASLALPMWANETIVSHGYSFYGDLSYPADYPHFSYVNPAAPKGGELAMSATGTFDSLNPYSIKGRAATGIPMLYESLLGDGAPLDVYGESYGLLAERLEYDVDKNWVIFYMSPEARFSNDTPVTAADVVFSHNLFIEQGLPSYAQAVSQMITGAEALDDHTVKFTFAEGISRRSLIEQVGGVPVFSKAWFEETGARLDEPRLETSPGSAPYMIDSFEPSRTIVYTRNPDYWGKDLPFNVGRHNFDRIRYEYFADPAAAMEGFKAGEYLFRTEGSSRQWATAYDFPAVDAGHVVKAELPDGTPPNATGFVFNLQRAKFQDARVREAISLAYNFEWTNQSLQYGLFAQRHSYVEGAEFEPKGIPQGAEKALLERLGDRVPAEVLTSEPVSAHSSNPDRLNDRKNLRKAMKLLDAAGWDLGDDGLRRNATGEVLSVVFPISSSDSATIESILNAYTENLTNIGVQARIDKLDPSQFTALRRAKDYDMIFAGYSTFLAAGTGLAQRFGSADAQVSVFNPATIASPMVDGLIDAALAAGTREEEYTALGALDRALRYQRAMVPTWYLDKSLLAYWDMYAYPQTLPKYGLGVMDVWWVDADKAAALKEQGALR